MPDTGGQTAYSHQDVEQAASQRHGRTGYQGLESGAGGQCLVMGTEVLSGVTERSGGGWWCWLHNTVHVLMPLNSTLKNGSDGQVCYVPFVIHAKQMCPDGLLCRWGFPSQAVTLETISRALKSLKPHSPHGLDRHGLEDVHPSCCADAKSAKSEKWQQRDTVVRRQTL